MNEDNNNFRKTNKFSQKAKEAKKVPKQPSNLVGSKLSCRMCPQVYKSIGILYAELTSAGTAIEFF